MVSALDILYIVLTLCALALTGALIVLIIEAIGAVRDMRRISQNVEHIASLVDRVAAIVFPGMEIMARGAESIEKKIGAFLQKKADKMSK